jgi:hypothetical protein
VYAVATLSRESADEDCERFVDLREVEETSSVLSAVCFARWKVGIFADGAVVMVILR